MPTGTMAGVIVVVIIVIVIAALIALFVRRKRYNIVCTVWCLCLFSILFKKINRKCVRVFIKF